MQSLTVCLPIRPLWPTVRYAGRLFEDTPGPVLGKLPYKMPACVCGGELGVEDYPISIQPFSPEPAAGCSSEIERIGAQKGGHIAVYESLASFGDSHMSQGDSLPDPLIYSKRQKKVDTILRPLRCFCLFSDIRPPIRYTSGAGFLSSAIKPQVGTQIVKE